MLRIDYHDVGELAVESRTTAHRFWRRESSFSCQFVFLETALHGISEDAADWDAMKRLYCQLLLLRLPVQTGALPLQSATKLHL